MSHPTSSDTCTRVAIVTGAAQGFGEAIALRLADDGLDVAVVDLPSKRGQLEAVAKAIRVKGRRCLVLVGDMSVEEDVATIVDKTAGELGGLDVVSTVYMMFASRNPCTSHRCPYCRWLRMRACSP